MFKGLFTGISGLRSQATKMEVIGNNLANVNTAGFKYDRVNFADLYYDVLQSGSRGGDGVIGGTNPMEVGMGVQVSSINTVYSQGSKTSTGRSLDFMIEGNDFFVSKSITNSELMLTRNGNFELDGNGYLVDSFGNKVMGFNYDRETGVPNTTAEAIEVPFDNISPHATENVELFANIDASAAQAFATEDSNAWDLFSTGDPWKQIHSAYFGGGDRGVYGSGYYLDTENLSMDGMSLEEAATTGFVSAISLGGASSAFFSGFGQGDRIQILQKLTDGTSVAAQFNLSTDVSHTGTQLNLSGPQDLASLGFDLSESVTVTNLTTATSNIGSSDGNHFNDVLNSQISMVDGNGNLLASYYLVNGPINDYRHATATTESGSALNVGIGEFTNLIQLSELMEQTLRDRELTHWASTNALDVSIDPFGSMSFQGAGLVNDFRLVINGENTNLMNYFGDIAVTDNDASSISTQARIPLGAAEGTVVDSQTTSPFATSRTTSSTKRWYDVTEWNGYKIGDPPETAYGQYAGLRLDRGDNSKNYGFLSLSMVNGLGQEVQEVFSLVAKDPDLTKNQFTNMGELAEVIEATLQSEKFSSLAVTTNGTTTLIQDPTAEVTFENGRLQVSTSRGVFSDLKLTPLNQDADDSVPIRRPDSVNFGTVLGELMEGVNGKIGTSNAFINPDAVAQTTVFDNKGNTHTVVTSFVKDRSAGLVNLEYKFKASLNPNLNSISQADPNNNNAYKNTFDSIEDTNQNFGTVAFDINTGKVIPTGMDGESRYYDSANLTFQPQTSSETAAKMDVTIDFDRLTSFAGENSLEGTNVDGFGMGELVRLDTENNTGMIRGVYSNGIVRDLAQLGLMHITNPEGLAKVGSSYYKQSPNSSADGEIKDITKVYSVTAPKPASRDAVRSKIIGHALEASNVDMTSELTEMIITQRSYSASGKIITTSDELLQELLSLKR